MISVIPFQFLYGTIGSQIQISINYLKMQISIPVWYDWKLGILHPNSIYQNISIPVWYDWKLSERRAAAEALLFQFLYGTIGSPLPSAEIEILQRFQFLYGTIGSKPPCKLKPVTSYFNSCMVRLEDAVKEYSGALGGKFQFLYGTIGSSY